MSICHILLIIGETLGLWLALKWLSWVEYQRGRFDGMAEAERRNRAQQQHDYDRGFIDATRAEILSDRQARPVLTLEDRP